MAEKPTFLTIDSGGSKTKLGLFSPTNDFQRETVIRGFGTATDSTEILTELQTELRQFCDECFVQSVVCNLGGRNKEQLRLTLQDLFPCATVQVFRESEGVMGLELCNLYAADITLLVGTGSIAIAPVGDAVVVSGGWGANISDSGSGYAVGLDVVKTVLKEIDGTAPLSPLTKRLTGLNEPPTTLSASAYCALRDMVRERLGPFDRAHIASFAKVAYDSAQNGDETAISIFKKAGAELADTVLTAAKKVGIPLQTLVVSGGMTQSKAFWQTEFEQAILEQHPLNTVWYLHDGIADALQQLAKSQMK